MSVLQALVGIIDQMLGVLIAGGMEGTGVPWPGAVIVAGAGVTAEGGWLSLGLLAAGFSLSYCLGALAQYAVGRLVGEAALLWLPAAQAASLQRFMERFGLKAVLWTRPLAIGNYMSLPAGVMRMPLARFLTYTFLGTWPWAFGMVLIGRFAGSQFDAFTAQIQPYLLPAVVALAAPALLAFGWRMLRRRAACEA